MPPPPDAVEETLPFAAITILSPAVKAPIALVFVKYKLAPSITFVVVKSVTLALANKLPATAV